MGDNGEEVEALTVGTAAPLNIIAQPAVQPQPNPTPFVMNEKPLSDQVGGTEKPKPEPEYTRKQVAAPKKGGKSKKSKEPKEQVDLSPMYEKLKAKPG